MKPKRNNNESMITGDQMSKETLIKLANYRMPFGKYAGKFLVEIPEAYYLWFSNKGFPEGSLGKFMAMMLEIKVNGLEYLLVRLKEEK